MGGVDLMDQRTAAYLLDRKLSVRFYLRILFHLMDIACVHSYLMFNMRHPNKNRLSLITRLLPQKNLIQYHQGPKRAVTMSYHLRGKTNLNRLIIMEDIYHITKQCENDTRTVQWRENCFQKHHI